MNMTLRNAGNRNCLFLILKVMLIIYTTFASFALGGVIIASMNSFQRSSRRY